MSRDFSNQSVPNIARARSVTPTVNPASQRSPLIALTNNGKQRIAQTRSKEGKIMSLDIPEKNIK
ncbi:MAG: hypothetical protein ACJAX5_000583 [Patiriisocius sp.]|jgi:hypothetical protein